MVAHLKRFAFRTRMDGARRAKRYHVCLDCQHNQGQKYVLCPECGSRNRKYFPSEVEFHRAMTLMTMRAAGTITNLQFHPKFDLKVNNIHICAYIADAQYIRDGQNVVEDSKPDTGDDNDTLKLARFKIALFEACYGMKVHIPQRKKPAPDAQRTMQV